MVFNMKGIYMDTSVDNVLEQIPTTSLYTTLVTYTKPLNSQNKWGYIPLQR